MKQASQLVTGRNYLIHDFTMKGASVFSASVASSYISIKLYQIVVNIETEFLGKKSKLDLEGKFKEFFEECITSYKDNYQNLYCIFFCLIIKIK